MNFAEPAKKLADKHDLLPLAHRKTSWVDLAEADVFLQDVVLEHPQKDLHRLNLRLRIAGATDGLWDGQSASRD